MGKMKNLAIDKMNLSSYDFEEYDLEQSQQGHINEPENWETPYFVKNFWDFIMK